MSGTTETRRSPVTGIVAVAATYVFFLIFAQFAFLEHLKAMLPSAEVQMAMGAMGVAGLIASLVTAMLIPRLGAKRLLLGAFSAAAFVAAVSSSCTTLTSLLPMSALIGVVTAVLTVTLASDLASLMATRRFGLATGIGTGVAYFVCNVPFVFEASVDQRSFFAAGVAITGALAVAFGKRMPDTRENASPALVPDSTCRPFGFTSILLGFLALIWFDSAAFAIVQETALKAETWGSPEQKLLMGVTHLVAAIIAGALIDQLALRALLPASFGLFAIAFSMLGSPESSSSIAGPLYAIGISAYSTALVAFPSSRGEAPGLIPIRWRAALLYGIAGWLGSALGVGMAQDLGTVPGLFIVAAGIVILLGWLVSHPSLLRRVAWAAVIPALAGLAALAVSLSGTTTMPDDPVERGHQVYLSEGCINCHSQYVRPGARDERLWGPYRGLDRDAKPPVPGNRRQGPDLQNVGNRRSAEWQRLHLIQPSSLIPTSRMPSYAYLFRKGSTRGDDLVAYLRSLGAETVVDRMETIRTLPNDADTRAGDPIHGSALYTRHCAQCHGLQGHGDGQLLGDAPVEPRDLLKEKWWFVAGPDVEPERAALARVVRYGLPGLTMPGHETWSSQDVADVVAWVRSMRAHDHRHHVASGR